MRKNKMRKFGFIVGVMLMLTLVFSGCGESGGVTGREWWQKIYEQYNSQASGEGENVMVYVENIRGNGSYFAYKDGTFHFSYNALNGNYVTLYLNAKKDTAHFDLYVKEGENSFYTNGNDIAFREISSYIDNLIKGEENYTVFNNSAMENDPDLVKSDLKILYARFLLLWDQAFSDLNPTLKSYGIEFGDAYRDIDATQPTSKEIVIVNEHQFENGVCKDCGMRWTEYLNRTLARMNGEELDEDAVLSKWYSNYGQKSADCGYYVQYSSNDGMSAELFLMDSTEPMLNCRITVSQDGEEPYIHVKFNFEEYTYSVGNGMVSSKYRFSLQTGAKPGEFDRIFSSKEAFQEACFADFLYPDKDNVLIRGWEEMSDEKLEKMLKSDKCVYYTKDEFVDFIWAEHERLLRAIDKGMVWYDTTLADLGMNYK